MHYLICDYCKTTNSISSERIVFCKHCNKKITNNYLDWKKSKLNATFEAYTHQLNDYNKQVQLKEMPQELIEPSKKMFSSFVPYLKHRPSKKSIIFFSSVFIQIVLFIVLLNTHYTKEFVVLNHVESPVLDEVKWQKHAINSTLSLYLPYELKNSKSVLSDSIKYYANSKKSQKAETQNSFSVTIESLEFTNYLSENITEIISIKDEYMNSPKASETKDEPVIHFKIQNYKTYIKQGSYTLNGKEYLFENYTLIQGKSGIKIIMSYLKDDKTFGQYASIVSKSILKNRQATI